MVQFHLWAPILEGAAKWLATRFEPVGIGNDRSSTLPPSANQVLVAQSEECLPPKKDAAGSSPAEDANFDVVELSQATEEVQDIR